ncbi:tetratricopeptide repeat protein [Desulfobacterales bacterium HSG2]|nr:tetratricopeptide repeat protein [Desulfobacterales bacterium HSG2]
MSEEVNDIFSEKENREQWDQLLFVLENRDKSTVAVIEYDGDEIKNRVCEKLMRTLSQYRFYDLDLTTRRVVSLSRAFKENLPESVLDSEPATYIVNLFGLENSLFTIKTGTLEESEMISELNFEREILFREFPFILILWADAYIVRKLREDAKDLWDWITYRFEFKGGDTDATGVTEPAKSPSLSKKRSPARSERIPELQAKYEKLRPDDFSNERIVREKMTLQKLLGQEYLESDDYENAIACFKTALALTDYIKGADYEKAEIFFRMGRIYSDKGEYKAALESYRLSLNLREKKGYGRRGMVYYQIGLIFEDLGRWNDALPNYQKALEQHENTGDCYEMGKVYYRMGKVFQAQRKTSNALASYKKALKWYESSIVNIRVISHDGVGLLADLAVNISKSGATILNVNSQLRKNNMVDTFFTLGVQNTEHLNKVLAAIRKVKRILEVRRIESCLPESYKDQNIKDIYDQIEMIIKEGKK